MLKKVIKNSFLCLMIMLSSYIISACCGPKMCEINVNFIDVDEALGIESYSETIEAGYGVTVTIDLPIGYVYDNFSAKVGDYELSWTVKLSDPTIEPEYEYAVAKTLTVKIDRVNKDHDIDIDMSGVRVKKLKVTVAEDILANSVTIDSEYKEHSNLQIVTLNPDYLTNLMYLKGDAILDNIEISPLGEAYVEYGNYAILCYTKDDAYEEMQKIYSSVGKYTPSNKIIEYKNNSYAEYDLSVMGNVPYNLYNGNYAISNSRLYYMGQIKEDMEFYRQIPDYDVTKGVTFEDKENQFVLLTNKQDYNSSLLSLSVYVPTLSSYDASNSSYDKVDGQTIVKLDKYDSEGNIKNASVYSQYGKRYDMISMYIGDSLATDIFLTEDERNSLSSSIYLVVESELAIGQLDISLLSYEKQKQEDFPIVKLTDYIISDKDKTVFKFDKTLVESFIKERTDSSTNSDYYLGNAYLDITFSQELNNENWTSKEFTTIMFPLELNGQTVDYDNNYQIEVFVEDSEGNRDYGLIDRHSSSADVAIFKSSQIYDWDGTEYVARSDFYISILGPEYNEYYSPIVETIFLYKPYDVLLVGQHGLKVEDSKVYNGVEKYSINLGMSLNNVNNSTYIGQSLRLRVALNITSKNTGTFDANFSNISFTDQYNDAIYMINNINFSSMSDFSRVDSIAVNSGDTNIRFGYYCDIYYFVYSEDENLEFDIYVGQLDEDTDEYVGQYQSNRIISGTKELRDILGNLVKIIDNAGKWHIVYTKYQICNVYQIQGSEHFAYNPNNYCAECDTKLGTGGTCSNCVSSN